LVKGNLLSLHSSFLGCLDFPFFASCSLLLQLLKDLTSFASFGGCSLLLRVVGCFEGVGCSTSFVASFKDSIIAIKV